MQRRLRGQLAAASGDRQADDRERGNASLTSTTSRSGGAKQVTYNGHPLYLFKGDNNPGDTNGQGLNAFGGSWYALSAAGDKVSKQPSSSGGGYGY